MTGELGGRSEPGTFRIRSRSAKQSSTRFDKRLVDFISTILSHFIPHIISATMWIPPVSLYIHIFSQNLQLWQCYVMRCMGESRWTQACDQLGGSAHSPFTQPFYLQYSPDRKHEWAQTRIWRSREGWTHIQKNAWQDRQNGICTPHQLLLLLLLLSSSSWSSSNTETSGNTMNG